MNMNRSMINEWMNGWCMMCNGLLNEWMMYGMDWMDHDVLNECMMYDDK